MNQEIIEYLLHHAEGLKLTYILKPVHYKAEFKDVLEDYYFTEIKEHVSIALQLDPEETSCITKEEVKKLLGSDFFIN